MSVCSGSPPVPPVPPFVLPDQHGRAVHTVRFRGRRNLLLVALPRLDADAVAYLRTLTARRDEWAWLHTELLALVPEGADTALAHDLPLPVLRDTGSVRPRLVPGSNPADALLLVADNGGEVYEWRTARRVFALPDADTALAWAWDVARPRGACDGGVAWARPDAPAPEAPPAPIGHLAVGGKRTPSRYMRGRKSPDESRK